MFDYATLRYSARSILESNDRGGYTVPNKDVYPFQWNWDSVFVALGWLRIDEKRAWQEIETLCKGQWKNGMIPSIVFHEKSSHYFPGPDVWQCSSVMGVATTGITQIPAVIPLTILMYHLANDRELAESHMTSLFSKLYDYQAWCYTYRRDPITKLCKIYHGWEAFDNSPMWDEALKRVSPTQHVFERKDNNVVPKEQRPTQWDYERYISILERMRSVDYDSRKYDSICEMSIIDAGFNAIVQTGNTALLSLVDSYGNNTQRQQLQQWAFETQQAFDFLWDDDMARYVDYDCITKTHIKEEISGSMLPLLARITGKNKQKYKQTVQQWIEQDMPSLSIHSAKFEPIRYWRGPSWTIVNFMIFCACKLQSWETEAEEIKKRSLEQIAIGDFYENFEPTTRKGYGGSCFSWTAASFLFWLDTEAYDFNICKQIF